MRDSDGRISELYDEAYFSERDFLPSHLLACLQQLLHKRQAHTVLEVGVGTGRLMTELRHRGYEVEGVDNSPIAASLAGARVASATDLPFDDGVFDCVIGVHMIEHLTSGQGEQFVDEVRRVLNHQGTVFLVTPNFASPLRYVQGSRWYGYSDPTHITFYRPADLRSLLSRRGFTGVTFTFAINSAEFDWPLPRFLTQLPPRGRRIVNRLLVSTPLAFARDSVWVSARKG